jgi:hypothetical protein
LAGSEVLWEARKKSREATAETQTEKRQIQITVRDKGNRGLWAKQRGWVPGQGTGKRKEKEGSWRLFNEDREGSL